MQRNLEPRRFVALLVLVLVSACRSAGHYDWNTGGSSMYTIGGTITGLTAGGLTLANGSDTVGPASGASTFTFPTAVASGTAYSVTVAAQPTGETCQVSNASGTVASSNVTSVQVTCSASTYSIGGSVTGLTGSGLVLVNGNDQVPLAPNATSFTFATQLASNTPYNVTIFTQPTNPSENCTVAGGSGTVTTSNVTNVVVTCAPVGPVGKFLFTANFADNSVSAFTIDPNLGALTAVGASPFATGQGPTAMALGAGGKFLYTANSTDGTISGFTVSNTGALTALTGSPFPGVLNASAMTTDSAGKYLYATDVASTTIAGFSIDQNTGSLTALTGSPFPTGAGHAAMAVDPNTDYMYTADSVADSVTILSLDPNSGALSFVGGNTITAGSQPNSVALVPGKFAYVLSTSAMPNSPTLSGFSINTSTGALTLLTTFTVGTSPLTLAIDPSYTHMYVTDTATINAFTINPDGSLTTVTGSPFAAGSQPVAVVTDPSGRFAYAVNESSNNISAYTANSTTGVLTAVTGSPFGTGNQPVAIVVE